MGLGRFHVPKFNPRIAIIRDFSYWNDNQDDIYQWLDTCTPNFHMEGIVLNFEKEQDVTSFLLRWA